jgi:flagellar protein FlbD
MNEKNDAGGINLITVTRLNGQPIILNALLIESIEETPDTLVALTTGKRMAVRESGADVVKLVKQYLDGLQTIRLNINSKEER